MIFSFLAVGKNIGYPGCHIISAAGYVIPGQHQRIIIDRCVRLQFSNRLHSAGCAAASVGDERDNGFRAEIVGFQKTVNRHRQVGPPVGIPQQDYIVLLKILHLGGQLRPDSLRLFLAGLIYQRLVIQRIGGNGFNAE